MKNFVASAGGAAIDLYAYKDTPVHQLHPFTKFAWIFWLSLCSALFIDLRVILCVYIVAILAGALASLSWKRLAAVSPLFFMFPFTTILNFFLFGSREGVTLLYVTDWFWVTDVDLIMGLQSGLRIFIISMGFVMLFMFTSKAEILWGLQKLALPSWISLAASITITFIPAMASMVFSVKQAQEARGLDLGKGGIRKRARNYIGYLAPILFNGVRMMITLPLTMQSRAWGALKHRTSVDKFEMRTIDYALISLFLCSLAFFIVSGFVFRLFATVF